MAQVTDVQSVAWAYSNPTLAPLRKVVRGLVRSTVRATQRFGATGLPAGHRLSPFLCATEWVRPEFDPSPRYKVKKNLFFQALVLVLVFSRRLILPRPSCRHRLLESA